MLSIIMTITGIAAAASVTNRYLTPSALEQALTKMDMGVWTNLSSTKKSQLIIALIKQAHAYGISENALDAPNMQSFFIKEDHRIDKAMRMISFFIGEKLDPIDCENRAKMVYCIIDSPYSFLFAEAYLQASTAAEEDKIKLIQTILERAPQSAINHYLRWAVSSDALSVSQTIEILQSALARNKIDPHCLGLQAYVNTHKVETIHGPGTLVTLKPDESLKKSILIARETPRIDKPQQASLNRLDSISDKVMQQKNQFDVYLDRKNTGQDEQALNKSVRKDDTHTRYNAS